MVSWTLLTNFNTIYLIEYCQEISRHIKNVKFSFNRIQCVGYLSSAAAAFSRRLGGVLRYQKTSYAQYNRASTPQVFLPPLLTRSCRTPRTLPPPPPPPRVAAMARTNTSHDTFTSRNIFVISKHIGVTFLSSKKPRELEILKIIARCRIFR